MEEKVKLLYFAKLLKEFEEVVSGETKNRTDIYRQPFIGYYSNGASKFKE